MSGFLDMFGDLERWQRQGETEHAVALATVVSTAGSSPRPLGARLLVTRSGRMSGAVSAGCVESDVYRRALEVLDSGETNLVRFVPSDVPELDVALACGGSIEVLIEPFERNLEVWRRLGSELRASRTVVVAELLDPVELRGCKCLFDEGGEVILASKALTAELVARMSVEARGLSSQSVAATRSVVAVEESARVFFEVLAPSPKLVIVGATEIGRVLCGLSKTLGMHVTIVDPRTTFLAKERFADADELLVEWPHIALGRLSLDANSSVVTLTHDPKIDLPALSRALLSEAGYVGALGSRRTHERRKLALAERGLSAEQIARVHGPVGLDLGGESAAEIALAILAEIVASRYGRDARAQKFVSGIVLAAGSSKRMGRPKQLLPLDGKPLLEHVITAAANSGLDEVVVVIGAESDAIRSAITLPTGGKVRWLVNERYSDGISESLRRGLAAASPRATTAAILLGDQPRITPEFIDQMLAAHAAAGKDATRPVFGGSGVARTPGHPVVVEKTLWKALRDLRGDQGARHVLAESSDRVHEMRTIIDTFGDIDTPEDYARATAGAD